MRTALALAAALCALACSSSNDDVGKKPDAGQDAGDSLATGVHADGAQQFETHWYQLYIDSILWPEAKTKCEGLQGYLACIRSLEENDFLHALAGPITAPDGGVLYPRPWLGGNNEADVNTWIWIDGSPWAFTHWDLLQPDLPDKERWLKMNTDGAWDDGNLPSSYFCEWHR